MYAISQLEPHLWQITLPKPQFEQLPYARPNNVYVITGPNPTLINAGHPTQFTALCAALEEIGVPRWRVERIIATSWSPDSLGGAARFERASIFAFSPDLIEPRRYQAQLDQQRRERVAFAKALLDFEGYTRSFELSAYEALLAAYFKAAAPQCAILGLSDGLKISAGPYELEVIACPGPAPGHIALYDAQRQWLFSGDLVQEGMPERLHSVQAFVQGLDRVHQLGVKTLLPDYGLVDRDGGFTLRYTARFLDSFVTNVPMALHKSPTLLEFVARDFGAEPSDELRYVETLRVYQILLEELGRARLIDVEGHGLGRRFGVGVNDPRSALRR